MIDILSVVVLKYSYVNKIFCNLIFVDEGKYFYLYFLQVKVFRGLFIDFSFQVQQGFIQGFYVNSLMYLIKIINLIVSYINRDYFSYYRSLIVFGLKQGSCNCYILYFLRV